jgi:hypothetical protein
VVAKDFVPFVAALAGFPFDFSLFDAISVWRMAGILYDNHS